MLKKITVLLLVSTQGVLVDAALPSCKFAKLPEKTDVIELKSKLNELSSVQLNAITLPDRTPYDAIRVVNVKDPSKSLILGFRCDWGQSILFRNATNTPAQLACYRCKGNTSKNSCPNLEYLEGDIEAKKTPTHIIPADYFTECNPINCSTVVQLEKCERSDRSLFTPDDRDRFLGLVEAPTPTTSPKK